MFTPLVMQRVTLYLVRDEAPDAALALGQLGVFEPESGDDDGLISEAISDAYRETFQTAASRLEKISTHLGAAEPRPKEEAPRLVPEAELSTLNDWLGTVWSRCSKREERLRQLRDELRTVQQLDDALNAYEPLDIDLGLLHEGFRFLSVRIGTVPAADVSRLREAVALIGYTLAEFSHTDSVAHVLLAGLASNAEELDRVLGAASFNELKIPPDFAAHPSRVRKELAERRAALLESQRSLQAEIESDYRDNAEDLIDAATVLTLASAYARISRMLQQRGGLARVAGWVPKESIAEAQQILKDYLGNRYIMQVRDPLPEERPTVPSAVHHPRLLRPFAALVRNYGIPRYGEVDPTWLFAISFIAMFGMMFGDIGHGLVIAAAGFFARRKLYGFAPFVVAIGASSTLFGFLYGSIFGYEELIHPLWIAPLSDPALMLRMALYWGIAFIVIMTAIMIRNRLKEGAIAEALLSGTGVTGAAFYLGIVYAAARWLEGNAVGYAAAAAVLIPLAVILGYEWHHVRAPLGEKVIVVFIEGFDTLLGYIANTLSFLRVAAFSLNHVALAIAVFTLANMLGPAGHWLVVVLGNLFILVLEGAIVTIQVLRLEYYEGFSRFFSGDGREFRPLTMGLNEQR